MTGDTILEASGLTKEFKGFFAVSNVDLKVQRGSIHALIGPNGAGKTTCFNLLTGRYKPDRGRVVFDGRDITGLAPRKIAAMGVARSFQLMNLFDEFSVLENVMIALPEVRAHGFNVTSDLMADSAATDQAARVLAKVGLAGKERPPARSLSYGERRALEIAVALACEPRILFLDEPTSGLGTEGTARLAELVQELRRTYTMVVIEHDMRFLFGLADRISVIHWGQVIAEGTPEELRQNPWIRASQIGAAA
jgi:branched-chain amino acid transport system ATP-binding protein